MRFAYWSAEKNSIYKITKEMKKEYWDIIGDKCVMNNACNFLNGMDC